MDILKVLASVYNDIDDSSIENLKGKLKELPVVSFCKKYYNPIYGNEYGEAQPCICEQH